MPRGKGGRGGCKAMVCVRGREQGEKEMKRAVKREKKGDTSMQGKKKL